MTQRDILLNEIKDAPESLLREVIDFLRFLRAKDSQENMQTAYAGETVLSKDWLSDEEEIAWQSL
jgi:hypothetical protein